MGYIKVFVAIDIGANIYQSAENTEAKDHLDAGTELWVKIDSNSERAQIFTDSEEDSSYISLVDIIAIVKPEEMGDLPTRAIVIHSTLDGAEVVRSGEIVTLEVELVNFLEDDIYDIQWKYCPADGNEFTDIEDANNLTYEYSVTAENVYNIWMAYITLKTPAEME